MTASSLRAGAAAHLCMCRKQSGSQRNLFLPLGPSQVHAAVEDKSGGLQDTGRLPGQSAPPHTAFVPQHPELRRPVHWPGLSQVRTTPGSSWSRRLGRQSTMESTLGPDLSVFAPDTLTPLLSVPRYLTMSRPGILGHPLLHLIYK